MISDPKTAPRLPRARIIYGIAIAAVASALIWLQPSEFGVKLALLASLTVVCSFVPILDRIRASAASPRRSSRWRMAAPIAIAAVVITVAVPVGVIRLASDRLLVAIDGRGIASAGPSAADIPTQ
jgi:hypothetical protein